LFKIHQLVLELGSTREHKLRAEPHSSRTTAAADLSALQNHRRRSVQIGVRREASGGSAVAATAELTWADLKSAVLGISSSRLK